MLAPGRRRCDASRRPAFEEYPTEPPSFVLNGAIFAAWGVRDVAVGLADAEARGLFAAVVETLAGAVDRWDTGYWSLYDLYPHRVRNVASPSTTRCTRGSYACSQG